MDNYILDKQTEWRYCRVKANDKRPYPDNWQKTPLELYEVDSVNIGLLLGPASGGTCAIDFDGYSAYTWAEAQGIDLNSLPKTPVWSSGKPGRCQMAFRVPRECWDVLRTRKITHEQNNLIDQGEGFEFRWTGGQSVLPPSVHPETGQPYEWLIDAMEPVADIPDDILVAWLGLMVPPKPLDTKPEVKIEDLDDEQVREVNRVLTAIKNKYPNLAYDQWRTVAWALAKELGRDAAGVLIRDYYQEQASGEYENLFKSWTPTKSPTMGTLYHMADLIKKKTHALKYMEYLKEQEELKQLEKRLKELRNDR
jgi:hypothetical protein